VASSQHSLKQGIIRQVMDPLPRVHEHFYGGLAAQHAPPGPVADFVRAAGGHSVISKVLICNNGIAAVKEIRSVRKWAYEALGDERAVQFTVMATPEDLQNNAEYIRMADQYVEVPGGSNANNYANVELIVDIAERMGVHAVWAGWGHASENPRLPEMLAQLEPRILFIGPPGSAMRSLGDKISSTIVAQHADVPCLPWSGTGLTDTRQSDQGFLTVPDDVYRQACVHSPEEGLKAALRIGFPVMIKASEGGGGKGIRMCASAESFSQLYHAAVGEVPGSPIFIMKLAGQARHLEVQLLADQYGQAISVFGRDCSVQRRHQKIIEEAPVTIAPPEARMRMEQAAVRLAKLVGYVSAGTVEWLYSPESGELAFLELNPRLQVEHPTTEMVSSVNIPAVQLQIAMGVPLDRIGDIRELYGVPRDSTTRIDFDTVNGSLVTRPQPQGHVVACRITAENPDTGFKPGIGALSELNFRSSTSTWGYFSVSHSGALHQYADSQFGHVFALGANREEARKNMVFSLKELSIRSEFRTTVEYLIMLLEMEDFVKNNITTGWLDGLIERQITARKPPTDLAVVCGATVRAHGLAQECRAEFKRILHRGQVPQRSTIRTSFRIEFIYEQVRYSMVAVQNAPTGWTLHLNGQTTRVSLRELSDGGLLISLGGQSHAVYALDEVGQTRLTVDQQTCVIEEESDPTQICSPSPGKLVRLLVESGSHVVAGQTIAEIEVMKMYLPLVAQESGMLSFVKSPGVSLNPGDLLGVLTVDDPSKITRAEPFVGRLPDYGTPDVLGTKAHQRFQVALDTLHHVLDGYDQSDAQDEAVRTFIECLRMPSLPFAQAGAVLSTLSGRLPGTSEAELRAEMDRAEAANAPFPAQAMRRRVDDALASVTDTAAHLALSTALAPLYVLLDAHALGLWYNEIQTLSALLERYDAVESQFQRGPEAVLHLRTATDGNLDEVLSLQVSHEGVARKNALLLTLLTQYIQHSDMASKSEHAQRMVAVLRALSQLRGADTAPVALKAREILIQAAMPSLSERQAQMEEVLRRSTLHNEEGITTPSLDVLRELSDLPYNVSDVLHSFYAHTQMPLAYAALVTYIMRVYRAYDIVAINFATEQLDRERALITWYFQMSADVLSNRAKEKERQASSTDLADHMMRRTRPKLRIGAMTTCPSLSELPAVLRSVLKYYGEGSTGLDPVNVLTIAMPHEQPLDDGALPTHIGHMLNELAPALAKAGLRRVSIMLCANGLYPLFATYRCLRDGTWQEHRAIRNVEPALSYQLELDRIQPHFEITPLPMSSSSVHLYHARGLDNPADVRFFVRALIRPRRPPSDVPMYLLSESERVLTDVFNTLEVAQGRKEYSSADGSHIFLSWLYPLDVSLERVMETCRQFEAQYADHFRRLRIDDAEIRLILVNQGAPRPLRIFVTTETAFTVSFMAYDEVIDVNGAAVLRALSHPPSQSPLHRKSAHRAYPNRAPLQTRRVKAERLGTTFVYDLPDALRQALRALYVQTAHPVPEDPLLEVCELVPHGDDVCAEERPPAQNTMGMVAWQLRLETPEFPQGRPLIVLANDVTWQAGSFGPLEDAFFARVCRYARTERIPLLYVSANSGARLGLATEPMDLFQAKFIDDDVTKGLEYLYVDAEGLARLPPGSVRTRALSLADGTVHHVLTDVIGAPNAGLGVECLSGSGLIAGEMSRARQTIFTTTIVTGRSVGIGAYLARLGGRVIQVETSPMILTGFQALNKLLGREVYTSNLQLGGPNIMHSNGVTHLSVPSDLDAMSAFLQWLAFVPERAGEPLCLVTPSDPVDRDVVFTPTTTPYDPRAMIEGTYGPDGSFLPGLFDRGSFQETLAGWATSVVVGRARLGGIPFGVIAVETRTLERVVPADPANPNSTEHRVMEAGQVWYPTSAYKTAQAIVDFDREGLPLLMLANWRGFSGGQQDMYDEILKQGSKIVDGLATYRQPVFVHIPPAGELRGGSWVVIDSKVNAQGMIEMTADTDSARGGVLEAAGLVEIKYRADRQRATMERLDPMYATLARELRDANAPGVRADTKQRLQAREKQIAPFFHAVAVEYADAHDRAGRMLATGVLHRAIPWKETRAYFYWRCRRRLAEVRYERRIAAANPALLPVDCRMRVRAAAQYEASDADQRVAELLEARGAALEQAVEEARIDGLAAQLAQLPPAVRDRLLRRD